MSATAIRPPPMADFPARGTAADKLAFAARRATAAAQEFTSAEFQPRESVLELRVRPETTGGQNSLDDRETLMGCGAMLEFTQLTLRHHGCLGRTESFPSFDEPDLVARIHTAGSCKRDPENDRLYVAMGACCTKKLPPAEVTSAELATALLMKAATRERSWVEFARCGPSRARLRRIASTPDRWKVASVRLLNQDSTFSASSSRSAGGWFRDRLVRWRRPQLAVTINPVAETASDEAESTPEMFAVLKTKTDDKHGWLAAGHSIGRLQLQARDLALGCTVKLAPLHSAHLRAELRPEFGHKGFVQAIVRIQLHPSQAGMSSLVAGATSSTAAIVRMPG